MPILSNLLAFRDATAGAPSRRSPGLLGLDVSKRAIGVAGADPSRRLATPIAVIRRTTLRRDIERLEARLAEREAGALVIGWPLNMDGSEGPRCQSIRQFAHDLDQALDLPMLLWDERLTTFAAKENARQLGLKGKKRDQMLDALAAAEILQDALNALATIRLSR